jgi:uncharacterized membrane protein YqjE
MERAIGDILREAINHIQEILRSEIRLAKTELKEEAGKAKRGAVLFGIGAVFGLYAAGFVLLAAVYLIAMYAPAWFAALAVGLAAALIAAIFLSTGWSRLKKTNVVPERTARTLKEDVQWVRQRTS